MHLIDWFKNEKNDPTSTHDYQRSFPRGSLSRTSNSSVAGFRFPPTVSFAPFQFRVASWCVHNTHQRLSKREEIFGTNKHTTNRDKNATTIIVCIQIELIEYNSKLILLSQQSKPFFLFMFVYPQPTCYYYSMLIITTTRSLLVAAPICFHHMHIFTFR